MSLTLDDNSANFLIKAYQPGTIKINESVFTQSLLVSATQLITDWPPQTITELTHAHLQMCLTLKPDLILLGTGETLIFPDPALYGELLNQGIGVEIMNTHAAARTYNALTAEDRQVVAALIIR